MSCVAWEPLKRVTLHGSVAITECLRLMTLKEKRFSLTPGSGALEVQSTASGEGPMLFKAPVLFIAQQEVGTCLSVVGSSRWIAS